MRMTLVILLAVLCATAPASARHRRDRGDSAPGEFDYYLLSLSWSPAYCLRSPDAAECNGTRRYGFILHGLWPQNERGWPENCDGDPRVPEAVVLDALDMMPARGLIFHEWTTHGTCSGLAPFDFFRLARRARDAVNIPADLTNPAAAVDRSPAGIVSAFMRANPHLPADSVMVACSGQGAPRLTEVHVCFDRGLAARACGSDALRRACRAASIIVPPIR